MPAILNERGSARSRWNDNIKMFPECDAKNFTAIFAKNIKNPPKGLSSKTAGILGRR